MMMRDPETPKAETGPRLPETAELWVRQSTFVEGQKGLFARRNYAQGEELFQVKGPVLDKPTIYTFSAALDKHIDPRREDGVSDFGHYLNHSCDPNVIVRPVHPDGADPYVQVVARRPIKEGDELAFDYASSEYEIAAKGTRCECGSGTCRTVIHGFRELPDDVREQYEKEGMIPSYLNELHELDGNKPEGK